MRSLRSYLPDPSVDHPGDKRLTVRIPVTLNDKLKVLQELNGWSPSEMVRAGLMKLVDDETEAPKQSFKLKRVEIDPQISLNRSAWK